MFFYLHFQLMILKGDNGITRTQILSGRPFLICESDSVKNFLEKYFCYLKDVCGHEVQTAERHRGCMQRLLEKYVPKGAILQSGILFSALRRLPEYLSSLKTWAPFAKRKVVDGFAKLLDFISTSPDIDVELDAKNMKELKTMLKKQQSKFLLHCNWLFHRL